MLNRPELRERSRLPMGFKIILAIVIIIIIAGIVVNQASIKRWLKDKQSEISNGIERTVEVYDINGKLIKKYEGKFDIEWQDDRIKFDDENNQRHIIYFKTGTIIVDEKP